MAINCFRGWHGFLSNFYEVPVEYDGIIYGSVEAAFQAQKCIDDEEKRKFSDLRPVKAKKAGMRVPLRKDWEDVKLEIMKALVQAKFTQNSELAQRLLSTGEAELIEGNDWNDLFWGVDLRTGQGENHLGRILMKIREEIRKEGHILEGADHD